MRTHLDLPEGEGSGPCIVFTFGWALGSRQGVARHLRELATHCARQGAKVYLLCVSTAGYSSFPRPSLPPEMEGSEYDRELAEEGVKVLRVSPHPLHWLLDGRCVRRAVKELMDRERIDAVLGIYYEAAYLPALLRDTSTTFGFVATWQSYRMALSPERNGSGVKGWLRAQMNQRFIIEPYRQAEIHFANSQFTRGELTEFVGVQDERVRVTYLGVDPSWFEVERQESEAIRDLFFFGRLVREKGIGDTIEALAELARKGVRDWKLRVAGSGNEAHVRELARKGGIEDQVELIGHLDDAGLKRELARAQLAILPSYSESFGLAIAEAQATALPVVAYAAGSVPEVVADGETAWLAATGNVQDLSRCIGQAIEDPAATHAAGLRGRERMRTEFGWDQAARKLLLGLRELRAKPGT